MGKRQPAGGVTHLYEMPGAGLGAAVRKYERDGEAVIEITEDAATITNGNITAVCDDLGRLTFTNEKREVLLKERWEDRAVDVDMMATDNYARVMKSFWGSIPGSSHDLRSKRGGKDFWYGTAAALISGIKGCRAGTVP